MSVLLTALSIQFLCEIIGGTGLLNQVKPLAGGCSGFAVDNDVSQSALVGFTGVFGEVTVGLSVANFSGGLGAVFLTVLPDFINSSISLKDRCLPDDSFEAFKLTFKLGCVGFSGIGNDDFLATGFNKLIFSSSGFWLVTQVAFLQFLLCIFFSVMVVGSL